MRLPQALPQLRGRMLHGFRIGWCLLASLLLAAIVFGSPRVYQTFVDQFRMQYGLGLRMEGVALRAPTTAGARAAGFADGQWIVGFDGHPVTSRKQYMAFLDHMSGLHDGDPIVLHTMQGTLAAQSPRDEWLQRSHPRELVFEDQAIAASFAGSPLDLESAALGRTALMLVTSLWLLAICALLVRNGAGNPAAAMLAAGFTMRLVPDWVYLVSVSLPAWTAAGYAFDIASVAMVVGLLAFPDGRFPSRPAALLAIVYPAFMLFADIAEPLGQPWSLARRYSYPVTLAAMVLAAITVWTRLRRTTNGAEYQQLKWARLGCVVGALFMCAARAYLGLAVPLPGPVSFAELFAWSLLLFGAAVGFGGGLLIALMRYRLYDAEAVISRSAAYGAITLLLAGVFTAATEIAEKLFEQTAGGSMGGVAGAIGAGIAVVAVIPLNNRIQAWAERHFQKDLRGLREDLPRCVDDLRETAGLSTLLDATLQRMAAGAHAQRAVAVLAASGEMRVAARLGIDEAAARDWLSAWASPRRPAALECDRGDPVFPIRVPLRVAHEGDAPIGWIMLGPRPDDSLQGKDEREALAEVADPVARAVRIVQLRDARERRLQEQLAGLAARIEGMERAHAH